MKKVVAILLGVCMLMSSANLSLFANAAESDSANATETGFYRIFHLDAARKFFSADEIKELIDIAEAGGYNQFELYLADNQGYRLELEDMTLTTAYGTYDLTPSLGAGYDHSPHYTDGKDKWLTQDEMDAVIEYANAKGIEIIPCINAPGHMGAILENFSEFWYSTTLTTGVTGTSQSALDLQNEAAYAFGQALVEKYAVYFASRGVKYLNIGADEYAADLMTDNSDGTNNGMDLLYEEGGYDDFVRFVNEAAAMIKALGMTPRAYNDCIYYTGTDVYEGETIYFDTDIEICYWNAGWSWGDWFRRADADYLADKGFKMINTNGTYYYILGGTKPTIEETSQFDYTSFHSFTDEDGVTITDAAGAMFCIWCDDARDETEGTSAEVIQAARDTILAFGKTLPGLRIIQVKENETYELKLYGDVAGEYATDDDSIATVAATLHSGSIGMGEQVSSSLTSGEYYLGDGNQYLIVQNGTWTMVDEANAIPWTIAIEDTGETSIKQGDYYLSNYLDTYLYCRVSTEEAEYPFAFDVENSNALYVELWETAYYAYWNTSGWIAADAYSNVGSYCFRPYAVDEVEPTTTTIAFTGNEVGITYVEIDGIEYQINVTSDSAVGQKTLYQINKNSTDVRLVAYVDDLAAYSKVSFTLTIEGRTSKELICTTAYTGLYAEGNFYTTDVIYGAEGHFVTYSINRYLDAYAGKEVTITTTYTTVAGETITTERTVTIE